MFKKRSQTQPDEAAQPEELPPDQAIVNGKKRGIKVDEDAKVRFSVRRWLSQYWWAKRIVLPLVVVAVLLAVPMSRYFILGLFMQKPATISVVDSKTGAPVSTALIKVGSKTLKTDANGKVTQQFKLGSKSITVEKQYYQSASKNITVTLSAKHNAYKVSLVATGRQVPIVVTNKLTGQPVAGAVIKALRTEAKTDKNGKATLVLPIGQDKQKGTIELAGYNPTSVTVEVTDKVVAANSFKVTPSGKLYFLSKRTGKIDVMKSDLDGANQQVVLPGTGNEIDTDTILLASQDWKYLALKARRENSSSPASVYLIDTSADDKLTTIDEGDAEFDLSGWSGHTFIYTVLRNSVKLWETKRQSLKGYNAENKSLAVLDSTTATGNSIDYGYELLSNVSILKTVVSYTKTWDRGYYYSGILNDKQHTINTVSPNGGNHKVVKTFAASNINYISGQVYKPDEVYFTVNPSDGSAAQYFELEDTSFKSADGSAVTKAQQQYITYLSSPSNTQTFWYESRDGKNTLFLGDEDGGNGKEIASLTEYRPYGWFGDKYLLLSKNDSELYIMPAEAGKQPVKITDYHKPYATFLGYGKGYGGF